MEGLSRFKLRQCAGSLPAGTPPILVLNFCVTQTVVRGQDLNTIEIFVALCAEINTDIFAMRSSLIVVSKALSDQFYDYI